MPLTILPENEKGRRFDGLRCHLTDALFPCYWSSALFEMAQIQKGRQLNDSTISTNYLSKICLSFSRKTRPKSASQKGRQCNSSRKSASRGVQVTPVARKPPLASMVFTLNFQPPKSPQMAMPRAFQPVASIVFCYSGIS